LHASFDFLKKQVQEIRRVACSGFGGCQVEARVPKSENTDLSAAITELRSNPQLSSTTSPPR
jgi:hypothetical protein